MRQASSFLSPLLFIPLIGLFLVICLFFASPPPNAHDPGGLAGGQQELVNQDVRRSKTSRRISERSRVTCSRLCVRVHVRAFQRGGGLSAQVGPDTGVSFRGCLGNEAEMIQLTPFLRKTGKVTLGS